MLLKQLQAYDRTDAYPFHMPGHKRQLTLPADAYHLDITEIDGFDNLHHAQAILMEEQQQYAEFVGAERTFFLVNGSTCGILAAISAAVTRGGAILMARNSHKAAYHALDLRQLQAVYCYPAISALDIQGAVLPEQIDKELEEHPAIQAVYLTSPTYDGVVSDVETIAQIVHRRGLPLIVDEAHGAHFGLHGSFPRSAVSCGADIVIQSVHKTLPAFTQSAVLHVCSDLVSAEKIARFLDIYESSSPSYVLMAGMSRLVPFLKEQGETLFDALRAQLDLFYEKSRHLKHLHVIQPEDFDARSAFARDDSKVLISTANCAIDGKQLYYRLLEMYHLQLEMYSGEYVTALCSLMDTPEGFERLYAALAATDDWLSYAWAAVPGSSDEHEMDASAGPDLDTCDTGRGFVARMYRKKEQVCSISEVMDQKETVLQPVLFEQAAGMVSAEYVYLYPPGIPLLVPGERIDETFIGELRELHARGFVLEGMKDAAGAHIVTVHTACGQQRSQPI